MTNPLRAKEREDFTNSLGLGQTRTVFDSKNERTLTITRTGRAYVYDLADAYNAARVRDGAEWFVDHAGALKVRDREKPQSKFSSR